MDDKLYKKDQEIEKLKIKIKEIEEKYKKEEKDESDKKSREIKRKAEEIKNLKNTLKEEEEKRRKAEISAEEKSSENSILKGQIDDYKSRIKQLEDNELTLRSDLGTNKAKMKGFADRIAKLQTSNSELESQFSGQKEEISKLTSIKEELQTEIRLQNEEIERKNSEITSLNNMILELQNKIEQMKVGFQDQIKAKEAKFDQYKEEISVGLSELKSNIATQDDEINKNQSLIRELEATKEKLEREIKQKDGKITELEDTIEKMGKELLERNMKINTFEDALAQAESGIIDSMPNLLKGKDQAIEKLRQVTKKIKHNAVLLFPSIEFLPKILNLDDIKATMKFRIMTNIDPSNSDHREIFRQYHKANIAIRNFDQQSLWGINRDREELVFAFNDRSGIPFGFKVEDAFQIEQLGNIFVAIWGKLREDFRL